MGLKGNKGVIYLKLQVINEGPLHIGSQEGDILLDKNTGLPYIPGSSIAGAIKAFSMQTAPLEVVEKYFGGSLGSSKVFVYDTTIENPTFEIRPGVRIDASMGVSVKGGYYEFQYLGKGCKFTIVLKAYVNQNEVEEVGNLFDNIAWGFGQGVLRLGGKKTSGAGRLKVEVAHKAILDLTQKEDLKCYLLEELTQKLELIDLKKPFNQGKHTLFKLCCKSKSPLLIKEKTFKQMNRLDEVPIKNAQDEYMIPGSSIKGVLRVGAKKICNLLHQEDCVPYVFGNENEEKDAIHIGRAYFEDALIQNSHTTIYNKIVIDKFTGGVMDGKLMNEETVQGELTIQVMYPSKEQQKTIEDKKAIALIALLLRDIALGDLKLGSGQGIGRGVLEAGVLEIQEKDQKIVLDFKTPSNSIKSEIINEYVQLLNEQRM